VAAIHTIREDMMKRERKEYRKPYGRGHYYELLRGGEGLYWRAASGLRVSLAAAEREGETENRDPSGEASPLEVWPAPTAG
jgi:hypothetical protein